MVENTDAGALPPKILIQVAWVTAQALISLGVSLFIHSF